VAEGDTLMVSELSRLARSVGQILTLIDRLIKKRVTLIAIKEGITLAGKADLQTKVMITLFSLFAEIERDLISERTREGLDKARKNGKSLGRPKGRLGKSRLDGKEAEISQLIEKGVSKASIAKIFSISENGLTHFIKTRKLGVK
jgi:DNA invertase Pin-like site-specific DNA recombinase